MATDPIAELHYIATAKRFDRSRFRDDTDFADWAQNRARAALRDLDPQNFVSLPASCEFPES